MSSISMLSKRCSKCTLVDTCSNKRIEACMVLDMPKETNIAPSTLTLSAPIIRDTSIQAQRTEYIVKQVSKELKKGFYKQYGCSFNKGGL